MKPWYSIFLDYSIKPTSHLYIKEQLTNYIPSLLWYTLFIYFISIYIYIAAKTAIDEKGCIFQKLFVFRKVQNTKWRKAWSIIKNKLNSLAHQRHKFNFSNQLYRTRKIAAKIILNFSLYKKYIAYFIHCFFNQKFFEDFVKISCLIYDDLKTSVTKSSQLSFLFFFNTFYDFHYWSILCAILKTTIA